MKESIEHQSSSSIKKGNENVNTISIKNSINLGDLIKKIKTQSKPRKRGGAKSGAGGAQMIEQIQGAPGMPGQAGAPGIDATPNQPFFPAPSSSSSAIPSYVSNTTAPQNFPVSNSVVPSYMSNATVPQQSIASTLENDLSAYERARKLAEDFGVPIPESLRTISSASSAQPNNPTQLKAVDNELKDEAQEILDRLPNVPIERSGSTQSIGGSSSILDQLYPMFSNSLPIKPAPPDIFSSSTGERSLENISSNSTQSKVSGLMPPLPFYNIPPPQERLRLQNSESILRKEQNKLEEMKNIALKESPRNIDKIKEIDNKIKGIKKERAMLTSSFYDVVDNNSTQSGLQLARSASNTSVASSVLPPRPPPRAQYAPPSINNFFEDVLALKNAPVKTQQQIARDLLREPLNIQDVPLTTTARKELRVRPPRVKKDYYTPPETRPILEDVRKFRQDVERSRNIAPQTSLLDQITSQPKPKPQERNLLGQAFGAFSNLLSSSRDARDAAGYGALALGAVQPELLPAIGAAETANQALNIIEAPVNAIERSIQARINNPAPTRKRKDAYGGF
jgi:hypothetical protein